jgi:hypothetical protein
MTTATKPIVLWCHPRSISSALERAFMQRSDFKCLHEPYSDPYYYHPTERLSPRFTDEQIRRKSLSQISYADVTGRLLSDGKRLFSKDMGQYIVDASGEVVISRDDLARMEHAFLVRSPELACPSYYRCCVDMETEFGDYDPKEAGYVELRILFDFIRHHGIDVDPVVIDAETLTAYPETTLKYLCARLHLE